MTPLSVLVPALPVLPALPVEATLPGLGDDGDGVPVLLLERKHKKSIPLLNTHFCFIIRIDSIKVTKTILEKLRIS